MYRLLIPQIFSNDIDKCIYLDSDIIVNLDINELWQIELDDKPLAAVPECEASFTAFKLFVSPNNYLLNEHLVEYEYYFNAGVLLMNLNYLRTNEELIMNGVKWYGEHPQCGAFDQDILNYLFSKNYLKLPAKFDRFIHNERCFQRTKIEQVIYHYSHPHLQLDKDDIFNRFWLSFFIKTPFFDEWTLGRLFESFRQKYYDYIVYTKTALQNLATAMDGKTRAFFISPDKVEDTKIAFSIRDDEEIIIGENDNSVKKLIKAMKRSKGKKIFFIMFPDFPLDMLVKAGFVFGKDFLNGEEFFPMKSEWLNSYPLIKDM